MADQQLRTRRRIVLCYLYGLSALWAVYCVLTASPVETASGVRLAGHTFLALGLAGQLGFMWFCTLDARLVVKPLPQLARIGIFLTWPIAVPIYFVWARQFKGLGLLLLHGVLWILLFLVTFTVLYYLRYSI